MNILFPKICLSFIIFLHILEHAAVAIQNINEHFFCYLHILTHHIKPDAFISFHLFETV